MFLEDVIIKTNKRVTILILLELTLQSKYPHLELVGFLSHNPYFIGINLAIGEGYEVFPQIHQSQSLFYWN